MNILREKTQSVLETLASEANSAIGIYAIDPANPKNDLAVNSDEVFPTASIIKIPILLEFYNQISKGSLATDEIQTLANVEKVGGSGVLQFLSDKTSLTIEDWVKLMINLSDNTATNYIIDLVGMDNVNKLLEKLDLKKTRLLRKMQAKNLDLNEVENLSTPRELSELVMMIMNHDKLDSDPCEKTIDVLKLFKDGIIRDALPQEYTIADKGGWMGGVQCDCGIVYADKPYIVTVMAKYIPKWDHNGSKASEVLKEAVAEIHEYFQNIASASRYGRRIR